MDDGDTGSADQQQDNLYRRVDRPKSALPKMRDRLDEEGLPMAPPPLEPSELGGWNPMKEDFEDPNFNSYTRGPGKDLPVDRRRSGDRDPTRSPGLEPVQLYVRGIPMAMTQEGLWNLFSRHGNVLEVTKCRSKIQDSKDTFGFVKYATQREAVSAMSALHDFQVEKCTLSVRPYKTPEQLAQERRERAKNQKFINNLHCGDEPASDDEGFQVGPRIESERGQGDHAGISRFTPIHNDDNNQSTPDSQSCSSAGQPDTGYSSSLSAASGPAEKTVIDPKPCLSCGKLGSSRCTRCKGPYCSKDCQRKDWEQHRTICGKRPKPATTSFEEDFESQFDIHVDGLAEELQEKMGLYADTQNVNKKSTAKFMVKDLPESKPPDGMFEAMVMGYNNPSDFCLVAKQDGQLLAEHDELLARLYQDDPGEEGYQPEVGELCAVFSTAFGCWYRARVDRLLPEDKVYVTFVDYGTPEEVLVAHMRPIHKDLTQTHIMGMSCALAGVVPNNSSLEWSPEAVQVMGEQMTLYKIMEAKVLKAAQGKVYVDLANREDGVNLASLLVEARHAKKVETKPKTPVKPPPSIEEKQAKGSSPQPRSPPEGSTVVPPQYKAPPANVSVAKFVHPGQKVKIRVLDLDSPSLFWVQCPEEESFQQLEELAAAMTNHYNGLAQKTGFTPQMKCLYAGKFPDDDRWYRAQVLSFDTNTVEVLFVDYGNKAKLTFDRVRALESPHGSLTLQAMACGMDGFPPDKQWTKEETQKFVQLLQASNLEPDARVVLKSGGYVMLELRNPKDGTPFAPEMASLAKPEEEEEIFWVKQLPDPIPPPINKVMLVYVLAAPSLESVYVQIIQDEPVELFRELARLLKTYATSVEPLQKAPKVGQLVSCVSVNEENEKSYLRAEVMYVYSDRKFKVKYLDHGYSVDVFLGSMFAPDDRLLAFPPLATSCKLQGLVASDRAWNPYRLEQKRFCMTVVSESNGVYEVELEDDGRASVNEQLVKENYAKRERHIRHQSPGLHDTVNKPVPRDTGARPKEPASHVTHQQRDQPKVPPVGHKVGGKGHTPAKEPPVSRPEPSSRAKEQSVKKPFEKPSQKVPAVEPSQKVPAVELGDLPQMPLLDKEKIVHVVVACATSVDYISVQLLEKTYGQQLLEVTQQIAGHTAQHQPQPYWPQQGEVCLALFSLDNCWYRAHVLNVGKQIRIRFIDFGNVETVQAIYLAPLEPAALAGYPPLAIRCRLVDIEHSQQPWEPKVMEERRFWMQVVSHKDGIYDVHLQDIEYDKDVRNVLFDGGFVQHVNGEAPEVTPPVNVVKNEPQLPQSEPNRHLSPTPEQQNALNDQRSAKTEPKQATVVENSKQSSRTDSRQQSVRFEQQEARSEPSQAPRRSVLQAVMEKMKQIGVEDTESRIMYTDVPVQAFQSREVKAICSYALGPQDIFLQLVMPENIQRFHEYMTTMDRYNSIKRPYVPKEGELVAARSRDDQKWYRAHVLSVDSKLLSVSFTDFGNKEYLSFASVQKLDKEFSDLPHQAIRCTLADVDPSTLSFDPADFVEHQFLVKHVGTDGSTTYAELFQGDTSFNKAIVECDRQMKIETEQIPDTKVKVLVSHVETPDRFFVLLSTKTRQLDQLMGELAEVYSRKNSTHQPRVDELVAVLVEEDGGQAWYRARVLQVTPSAVSAFLVDFGQVKVVLLSHVCWLEGLFRQLPCQAIACGLTGVQGQATVQWSSQESEAFSRLVFDQVRLFTLEVVSRHANVLDVRMWDGKDLVSDSMMRQGIALRPGTDRPAAASPASPVTESRQARDEPRTAYDNKPMERQSPQSQPGQRYQEGRADRRGGDREDTRREQNSAYDNKPMERQSPQSQPGQHYQEGRTDRRGGDREDTRRDNRGDRRGSDQQDTRRDPRGDRGSGGGRRSYPGQGGHRGGASYDEGVTQSQQRSQSQPSAGLTMSDLPRPTLLRTFSGVVYQVVSPWEIYISHASQEVLQTQARLTNELNGIFNDKPASRDFVPIPRQLVAAKFSDGDWYRAVVLSVDGPQQVHVLYLEFGNDAVVPPTDIHPLPPSFTTVSAQAVRCSLSGVVPRGGEQTWSKACRTYLRSLINEKAVQVKVVDEMANPPTVDLDLPGADRLYVNVRSNLVNQGHAMQHGP